MSDNEWKPTTIEEWRKVAVGNWQCYEEEVANHNSTKHRLEMYQDLAEARQQVLFDLLVEIFTHHNSNPTEEQIGRWVDLQMREKIDAKYEEIQAQREKDEVHLI